MTYLGFHLYFIVPPLLLFFLLAFTELRALGLRSLLSLLTLVTLALVYTTPWDNYLVFKEVWWYGADKVMGTLFYVPIEEYLFFILQTFLSGFLYLFIARPSRWKNLNISFSVNKPLLMGSVFTWILSLTLFMNDRTFYLGLILSWALPVIFLQINLGHHVMKQRGPLLLLFFILSTLYLSLADHYAVTHGIWSLSNLYTIGLNVNGLPVEEIIFFLCTNIMVTQGLCLFLDPTMSEVIQKLRPGKSISAKAADSPCQ